VLIGIIIGATHDLLAASGNDRFIGIEPRWGMATATWAARLATE
jgi:hypothetical protein